MKKDFITFLNYPKSKKANYSNKFEVVKKIKESNDDGVRKITIIEADHVNIYDKIQENTKGTSVYEILDRYINGDVEVLQSHQTVYGDLTQVPKDILEAQNLQDKSIADFSSLPEDLRAQYGNNPERFMNEFDFDKLNDYINSKIQNTTNGGEN